MAVLRARIALSNMTVPLMFSKPPPPRPKGPLWFRARVLFVMTTVPPKLVTPLPLSLLFSAKVLLVIGPACAFKQKHTVWR